MSKRGKFGFSTRITKAINQLPNPSKDAFIADAFEAGGIIAGAMSVIFAFNEILKPLDFFNDLATAGDVDNWLLTLGEVIDERTTDPLGMKSTPYGQIAGYILESGPDTAKKTFDFILGAFL